MFIFLFQKELVFGILHHGAFYKKRSSCLMSNLIKYSQLMEARLTMFLEYYSLTYLLLIKKLAKQNLFRPASTLCSVTLLLIWLAFIDD